VGFYEKRVFMIDYHCHILPGLDDGCRTVEESIMMARQLNAVGFSRVCCTPHCITGLYDFSAEQIMVAVAALQQRLDREGITLRLETGMEYYLDDFLLDRLDRHRPMTLGKTDLLLFELPSSGDVCLLPETVRWMKKRGLQPVLAHPERFFAGKKQQTMVDFVQHWLTRHPADFLPAALLEVVEQGCLLQADLGSFNGVYGANVRRLAMLLQQQGMYACVGSDGHSPRQAETILRDNFWFAEQMPQRDQEISCEAGVGLKGIV